MSTTLDLNAFTEKYNLPDQAIDVNEIPWVPTFTEADGVWFKPVRFDLTTGNWIHISKFKAGKGNARHRHTGGDCVGLYTSRNLEIFRKRLGSQARYFCL
ncbi:cupin domain-containing protein [Priestia megaterium]|uniref:cupin domain-containing protein n=1 Tax=Priestia megaterium TaxID=1404 RepID=UPI00399D2742